MPRDLGWNGTGAPVTWGAIGGFFASILIGIPMQMQFQALENTAAALVGSDSLAVGWMVHLLAGTIFGALYGAFVSTRSYARGAGYGLAYGVLVGLLAVWLALNLVLGRPIPTGMMAIAPILAHVVWGLFLGLIAVWGLRRTAPGGIRRRTAAPRA